MSRLDKIIAREDANEILGVAIRAQIAAAQGEFCECEEPSLHKTDLMCGNCLRENQAQIAKKEALIRGPHEFVPRRRAGKRSLMAHFCDICARPENDERHAAASPRVEEPE
jgi:hypothetical protein